MGLELHECAVEIFQQNLVVDVIGEIGRLQLFGAELKKEWIRRQLQSIIGMSTLEHWIKHEDKGHIRSGDGDGQKRFLTRQLTNY